MKNRIIILLSISTFGLSNSPSAEAKLHCAGGLGWENPVSTSKGKAWKIKRLGKDIEGKFLVRPMQMPKFIVSASGCKLFNAASNEDKMDLFAQGGCQKDPQQSTVNMSCYIATGWKGSVPIGLTNVSTCRDINTNTGEYEVFGTLECSVNNKMLP